MSITDTMPTIWSHSKTALPAVRQMWVKYVPSPAMKVRILSIEFQPLFQIFFLGFNLIRDNVFTCILPSNTIPETCTVPRWSLPPESSQLPFCQRSAIPCPAITAPRNGRVVTADTCGGANAGQVCQFACNRNYVMNGEESLECLPDGTWNGVPPTCDREIIECPGQSY